MDCDAEAPDGRILGIGGDLEVDAAAADLATTAGDAQLNDEIKNQAVPTIVDPRDSAGSLLTG